MRQYDQDYAGWAEDTARAITEGRWNEIDRASLADEVLGLSKTDRHKIEAALRVVLLHLLKAKYQPLKHTRSWDLSIVEHRQRLYQYFEDSPSLLAQNNRLMERAYQLARVGAARQTGLELNAFPESCPWIFSEVMGV